MATLVLVCGDGFGWNDSNGGLFLFLLMEIWGCLQATHVPTKNNVGNTHLRPWMTFTWGKYLHIQNQQGA